MQYLTQTRRKLHALAEISGKEFKTQEFIINELKGFGYSPKTIGTGVYCDVGSGKRRLALRADIDALPMTENVEATGMERYAACGAMHACGHDGHTANLLNVARILGGKCDVSLRFIFQFGEEDEGGSLCMIENGVLDGVDEIYALHLCPELEAGKIGYCYGGMFAGCTEFNVFVRGRSSHCAMPQKGADALRAAIDVADAVFACAERENLLVNLGKMCGGSARNVIADECESEYTFRFYEQKKSEKAMLETERAALAADDKYGTTHDIKIVAVYPPLVNDALCVDIVRSVAGDKCVPVEPRYTAEDFSYYLQRIAGCMVWLGVKSAGHESPLHSDSFSFDESALLTGTELFLGLIEQRKSRLRSKNAK